MRVVADTNTVVSALLWHGPPRRILDAARSGQITLFTCAVLLAELEDVLKREKLAQRLAMVGLKAEHLVVGYAALATLVTPARIEPVIPDDPEDNAVLACAVAARAEAIVSGDRHLLKVKKYRGIPILMADEFLNRILEQ
ncbi:MAG: putative toxin-antitoxin system toxin component, PIN family [Planctomycetota bacterium]